MTKKTENEAENPNESIKYQVKSISFSKYRGFSEPQTLELKPITLLFGRNSVGKSAALRLIPILAAAARNDINKNSVLDYRAPALRGAIFGDIISNGQISSGINVSIEWKDSEYKFTFKNINERREIITNFNYSTTFGKFVGNVDLDSKEVGDPLQEYSNFNVRGEDDEFLDEWKLEGLRAVSAESETGFKATKLLGQSLDAFGTSVVWLEAIRSSVPRFFEFSLKSTGRIEADGSGVAEALCLSNIENDGISQAVSSWLERTCNCSLSYSSTSSVAVFNRKIFPFNVTLKSGSQIAIRDIGEGVAQTLPVVTICHQARLGN